MGCDYYIIKVLRIYYNDKFNKSTFETKYKSIVENKINNYGKIWL